MFIAITKSYINGHVFDVSITSAFTLGGQILSIPRLTYLQNLIITSWGERNTAVTQFLETFEERQKTFLFCSFLLNEADLFRTMN